MITITDKTTYKQIKKHYPDATKIICYSQKQVHEEQALYNRFGKNKKAKCLQQKAFQNKTGWRCSFVFSIKALGETVEN